MPKKTKKADILPSQTGDINYINNSKKLSFYISVCLDRVNLFSRIREVKLKSLINHLRSVSLNYRQSPPDSWLKWWKFTVSLKGQTYKLDLRESHTKKYYPDSTRSPYILQINNPAAYLFQFLEDASKHNVRWSISEVEFSCDFFGDDLSGIYEFLMRHTYMNWYREEFRTDYPTTNYYNNVRKSNTMGGKIYQHPKEGPPDRVRIELTAKAPFLRRKKINRFIDLFGTRPEEIFSRITFRDIDLNRFERYVTRQDKQNGPPFQATSKRNEVLKAWDRDGYAAAKKVVLKHYPNSNYCFLGHPFQDEFTTALQDLSFSDGVRWRKNKDGLWVPAGWAQSYRRVPKAMQEKMRRES